MYKSYVLNYSLFVQVRQAAGLRAEKASLRELAYGASGIIRLFLFIEY